MSIFVKNTPIKMPYVLSLAVLVGLAGCTSTPTNNSSAVSRNITFKNGVPSHYQVKSGDTVSKIAQRYDLNWREISAMNRLDSNHTIYIGQWLMLWQQYGIKNNNTTQKSATTQSSSTKTAATTTQKSTTPTPVVPPKVTPTPPKNTQVATSATSSPVKTPTPPPPPPTPTPPPPPAEPAVSGLPDGVPVLLPAGKGGSLSSANPPPVSPSLIFAPTASTPKTAPPAKTTQSTPSPTNIPNAPTVKAIGQFRYPVGTQNRVVGQFGAMVGGVKSEGMFFAGHDGDVVVASQAGVVVFVDDKGDKPKAVVVQHSGGYLSSYIHLKDIAVKKGQTVSTGTMIGSMQQQAGNLALFEFRMAKDGAYIDPVSVLK